MFLVSKRNVYRYRGQLKWNQYINAESRMCEHKDMIVEDQRFYAYINNSW